MRAIAEKTNLDEARSYLEAERACLVDEMTQAGVTADIFESNILAAAKEWRQDYLREIEHALEKLNDGTYGRCDSCGEPIEPERLIALPHSSLCLNCKTRPNPLRSKPSKIAVRNVVPEDD